MIDYPAEFHSLIQKTSSVLEREIARDKYEILDRGVPHIPQRLPHGKMGIYTFLYNDRFLKIGKAGTNSGPRFLSQHYNPRLAKSTLAASLLADKEMHPFHLDENNVKDWIKQNCRRIDVIMDAGLSIFALGFVEAILHFYYEPKYEGFSSQRKNV